jgi:hypothetical protein
MWLSSRPATAASPESPMEPYPLAYRKHPSPQNLPLPLRHSERCLMFVIPSEAKNPGSPSSHPLPFQGVCAWDLGNRCARTWVRSSGPLRCEQPNRLDPTFVARLPEPGRIRTAKPAAIGCLTQGVHQLGQVQPTSAVFLNPSPSAGRGQARAGGAGEVSFQYLSLSRERSADGRG